MRSFLSFFFKEGLCSWPLVKPCQIVESFISNKYSFKKHENHL
jgi:hypothetical protein